MANKKSISIKADQSFLEKMSADLAGKDSYINLALGALIIIIAGVLVFNYFNKPKGELGSADQNQQTPDNTDVSKDNLPGKYTVKRDDTLFIIAKSYYNDGYSYPKIASANKLADENIIEVGQVLEIPKLEQTKDNGTGGATNQTIWGEAITADTYTTVEGDWLSKIAGRSYGDPMAFDKIAKANNIQNPDIIESGTVLKIPR